MCHYCIQDPKYCGGQQPIPDRGRGISVDRELSKVDGIGNVCSSFVMACRDPQMQ